MVNSGVQLRKIAYSYGCWCWCFFVFVLVLFVDMVLVFVFKVFFVVLCFVVFSGHTKNNKDICFVSCHQHVGAGVSLFSFVFCSICL